MQVEVMIGSETAWHEIGATARRAEAIGADRVGLSEITKDPFLQAVLVAGATTKIGVATSIALAFPRSPMTTAVAARNLHDLSGGRFTLGLGTQVRAHVVRRFAAEFDPPGPRLRDYASAVRAVWRCWETGEPLDHRGPYYPMSLMNHEFSQGPSPYGPIPLQLAAVNTYNLQTAASSADGVRLHSFTTVGYLRDVILPLIATTAREHGRTAKDVELMGGGFIATGPSDEAVAARREWARRRVAWYASTPAYLPVLAHHGWEELHERTNALVKAGRWDDLAAEIDDEVLSAFCLAARFDELPGRLQERMGGLSDTVTLSLADPTSDEALAEAVAAIKTIGGHTTHPAPSKPPM